MKSEFKIRLSDVIEAEKLLRKYLTPTPLLYNSWLSQEYGCEIYLKLENMQPIGSFKIRGATHKILNLTDAEKKRGVIAASAGNHAQGVAWGSQQLGVNAQIVMPKGAPIMKVQNTRALGAEVILEGANYDEAFAFAKKVAKKSGRVFVHAFADEVVMAGQGTVALEMVAQLPDLDIVVGAVGGGGLMAGISVALKELKPRVKIVACQASGAPSMIESIKKGRAIKLDAVHTFADGIAVKYANEGVRKILAKTIDRWVMRDDEDIASAILMLMEKAKTVAEGAGALPLASLEAIRPMIRGKKVVLLVCGGNIDVNVLARIIDRGLIRAGRRLRINVLISDRPGSLATLTDLLAEQGVNILQAIHDRDEPSTRIDQTEVALTIETKGPKHSAEVIAALKKQVLRVELLH